MNGDIAVFAGSSNKQIAEEICTHLNIQPGKINLKKFSDGEISVKVEDNVRGRE
ncbi:ribose-phosphate pyrophosphokinase-like domain-containing protein, partial [Leptospira interrogans]